MSAGSFVVDPKITSISPTSGPVGTILSVSGSGLAGADHVSVNDTDGVIQSATANLVKIQVAAGSTTGAVRISTATSAVHAVGPSFRVLPSVAVGGFSRRIAQAGERVDLTGWNLNDVASAKLGSLTLTDFHVDSATRRISRCRRPRRPGS